MATRRAVLLASALIVTHAKAEDFMETELHVAAAANDAGRVKALLASGAKRDARDNAQSFAARVGEGSPEIDIVAVEAADRVAAEFQRIRCRS